MVSTISKATSIAYLWFVKPLLFRSSPDSVHSRLLRISQIRQKLGWTDSAVRYVWAYRNDKRLEQTLHGIAFSNPVGLAAGFDKNVELVPTMKAVGFGFMTGGSVTCYPCEGNPRPWFYRLPKQKSLVVHVGLANEGTQRVMDRLSTYPTKIFQEFPLVISVAKTNNEAVCNDAEAISDYIGSLKLLQHEPMVSVIELNISCPNAYGGEPFTDPRRLGMLLQTVDVLQLPKPLWLKMPVNMPWSEFEALLKVIVTHNVQGVTIGNLSKNRGEIPSEELPSRVKGNLSGLPTQSLSDNLIMRTYATYGDRLTIIGVGGIFSAKDAYRKITYGASLVELITGMIYQGPQLIGSINHELAELLEKDGFANIAEAVGSAQNK